MKDYLIMENYLLFFNCLYSDNCMVFYICFLYFVKIFVEVFSGLVSYKCEIDDFKVEMEFVWILLCLIDLLYGELIVVFWLSIGDKICINFFLG